jgi:hypothetical protein
VARRRAIASRAHGRGAIDRRPIDDERGPPPPSQRCSDDGECSIGCDCERFDSRIRWCDLQYREDLRGAWCGCVRGRCAWFR